MIYPRIIKYRSSEYEEMVALRAKILRQPLGLTFSEDDLIADKDDLLLALCMPRTHKLVACCILTPLTEDIVKLRQMAVDDPGIGLGSALLGLVESLAKERNYKTIVLHARKVATGFYQKCGYNLIGDEFIEVGIPHLKMEKQIK